MTTPTKKPKDDVKDTEEVKAPVEETSEPVSTPKPPNDGKVLVDMEYIKKLGETVENLKKTNDMLLQVADKKAMAKFNAINQIDLPLKVCIREMNVVEKEGEEPVKKIVIGWRSSKDVVEYDKATKRGFEDQRTLVLFEDGTKKEYQQNHFELNHTRVTCTKAGQVTDDKTGNIAYKLIREDTGKEYIIGVQYVN